MLFLFRMIRAKHHDSVLDNGVERPADLKQELPPTVRVPFTGDKVRQLVEPYFPEVKPLVRREADPSLVVSVDVGMCRGSKPMPRCSPDAPSYEDASNRGVILEPLGFR